MSLSTMQVIVSLPLQSSSRPLSAISAAGVPVEQRVSLPVTHVELAGEWKEMGSVSFKPDQVFLMAIVEAPVGRVFIRFAGQTETVEANRDAFMEMILGLRRTPT